METYVIINIGGNIMKKIGLAFVGVLLASCCFFTSCASMSGAKDMGGYYYPTYQETGITNNDDSYTEIVENAFVKTSERASSYFSIDANTASYPNLRSLIGKNGAIDKDAVRIEEMLNYFDYNYETPTDGSILALTSSVFDTPYNSETKLLTIGLAAQEIDFTEQRSNIVFLIDTSGSMYGSDRLGLVQEAFKLMTQNLNDQDRVSIVTYASGVGVALDGAYGYEKKKIMAVIEDLEASGSTAGSKGIQKAYEVAQNHFIEGGNNRIILATDGDFNVGITGDDALKEYIAEKRETGVYFSIFGVGNAGNFKSSKVEGLALNGNGTYSYLDSVKEAKRALVDEMGGTLLTVAKDVKAGITFNPEYVDSYRLIGYENKLLTQEEFENSETDAGELGSGHKVTVAYEIKLTEKAFELEDNLAQVVVKYKPTENSGGLQETSEEIYLDVKTSAYHSSLTVQDVFVAGVIEFGLLLRNSNYKADASLSSLIERLFSFEELANDEFKEEFRQLVKKYAENQKNE